VLVWWALGAAAAAGKRVLLAGAAALAFGLFIELVQWPIPYRSFDLRDWAADAVGVAIGLVAVTAWRLLEAAPRGRRRAYFRPHRHNR
jgi:VanZ family protein